MKKERVKNKASDAFGDAWAKKRIEEAIDVEREITKELIDRLEKSSHSCGSCGMLWPDHGEKCGLWVRREAVEKEQEELRNANAEVLSSLAESLEIRARAKTMVLDLLARQYFYTVEQAEKEWRERVVEGL